MNYNAYNELAGKIRDGHPSAAERELAARELELIPARIDDEKRRITQYEADQELIANLHRAVTAASAQRQASRAAALEAQSLADTNCIKALRAMIDEGQRDLASVCREREAEEKAKLELGAEVNRLRVVVAELLREKHAVNPQVEVQPKAKFKLGDVVLYLGEQGVVSKEFWGQRDKCWWYQWRENSLAAEHVLSHPPATFAHKRARSQCSRPRPFAAPCPSCGARRCPECKELLNSGQECPAGHRHSTFDE